ncbi:ParB-like nuclease domain-containing protein [Megasphaera elsdenii]|uniref:ParB N-terminal domain-containing protein n=1 Tax=Megasphaera elsdenii TaxID=907 RepID=UPI0008E3B79D|nr:ParB N-terminal domain-containing protein [Megasphaera elsdenii]SFH78350.1 ParB-like nuclease domain-containing protein [Megasphaera elsdenii]
MATYYDIKCLPLVNNVDKEKVEEIKNSILTNGWKGCPILYTDLGLVTGSHRLAALQSIEETEDYNDVLDENIAEDVSDIINDYCEKNDTYWDEIDFSYLRDIFAGTWVEEYKDEIEEW